jgi:hypothetical protein
MAASAAQLEEHYDVLDVWRGWAEEVRGRVLDCGHYLPEEAPEETYVELRAFFSSRMLDTHIADTSNHMEGIHHESKTALARRDTPQITR